VALASFANRKFTLVQLKKTNASEDLGFSRARQQIQG
jgi:hypothetical protein